ncbi:hypothetical protein FEQ05_04486 [Burkholderia pseudomultivorans]|uniref:Uncharacterized protein n=1 Tax=Burkholderia pseudomultivorans TaxID=1207504 RepID=A0ABU2EBI5_9BURK|nr:hypothetical protein [Burkholderia pseudomultivorans]MDR8732729.1 hypothetical protein [Burkholderia pseudomultivorans]MDR8739595.1 hypothetical protein [Burkholderia pseudomultivorans]MDR8757049.1 hypothetical protein [Burkholderia pseudomultivorans]MDR8778074.1 hypothetical protein [Burkholderia pseudomultivorans]
MRSSRDAFSVPLHAKMRRDDGHDADLPRDGLFESLLTLRFRPVAFHENGAMCGSTHRCRRDFSIMNASGRGGAIRGSPPPGTNERTGEALEDCDRSRRAARAARRHADAGAPACIATWRSLRSRKRASPAGRPSALRHGARPADRTGPIVRNAPSRSGPLDSPPARRSPVARVAVDERRCCIAQRSARARRLRVAPRSLQSIAIRWASGDRPVPDTEAEPVTTM